MAYFQDMIRVLQLDTSLWVALARHPRILRYAVANVLILGLVYAGSAVYFSQRLLASRGLPVGAAQFNPLMVLMVGASVAFLMHGGAALFTWVFCRGIGGATLFLPLYLSMGTAAVALWPAAPAVALLQTGVRSAALAVYLAAAIGYGLAAQYPAVRQAAGLSHTRMAAAGAFTLFYVGCFLYLWL